MNIGNTFRKMFAGGQKETETAKQSDAQGHGHGNVWEAMADEQAGSPGSLSALPQVVEDEKGTIKIAGEYVGIIGSPKPVTALALLKKTDGRAAVWSFYPFFDVENSVEILIDAIYPWGKDGFEGTIEGTVNGMMISFFDGLFFENKSKYERGKIYKFHLGAVASSFDERTENLEFSVDEGPVAGTTHDTRGMVAFMPKNDYKDFFEFAFPFGSFVGSASAFGAEFLQCNFEIVSAADDGKKLSFPIFVRKGVLKGYSPKSGDPIHGIGWLEGHLAA